MRTADIIMILLAASLAMACRSGKHSVSKRLPGVWQAQPVTIDGNNKDWPSPYPEYDSKAMLGYAVSNDKDNLYITVETGDLATQLKILREGLTVWIDKTGGKEEVTAINFPIPASFGKNKKEASPRPEGGHMQPAYGNNSGGQDKRRFELEGKVKRALGEVRDYSLQGFKGCNLQYPLLQTDSCGIVVRIDLDADNELVWEAKVPFSTFYYKPQVGRMDKGKLVTICFETTGITRPAGQGGGSHGGGGFRPSVGMGGMGMHMGGGGMRGGRGGTGQATDNSMMESLYKSTKTYKTFGIAYQE